MTQQWTFSAVLHSAVRFRAHPHVASGGRPLHEIEDEFRDDVTLTDHSIFAAQLTSWHVAQ
jgi:hypothetical protein